MLWYLLFVLICIGPVMLDNLNPLTGLTFSAINCNSLNMSAAGKNNQYLKLYGITKLRTDVIFMADIRLKSRNLVSCANDVEQIFLHNPYGSYASYFNSNNNKRGVGILI
jgi:hypothetical protein